MRAGDDPVRKKVLFGSMVETSGADESSHFMKNDSRQPRSAMKQNLNANSNSTKRGMSQAPALSQKQKLDHALDVKKGHGNQYQSKLQQAKNAREQRTAGASQPAPRKERLGDGVPTYDEVNVKYADNIEQLGEDHEKIIEQILEEEEQLIFKHNTSCK